jgi:hypothetical protein
MGDNEFSQYSSASHRHSASLDFHPLGEAAAMYSGLSGSAEVSPNRPFAETSADPDSPLYILNRGFGLKWPNVSATVRRLPRGLPARECHIRMIMSETCQRRLC